MKKPLHPKDSPEGKELRKNFAAVQGQAREAIEKNQAHRAAVPDIYPELLETEE